MLGIDIFDLQDLQVKHRTNRSLRLIQCPNDILINHPQLFWLLWTAKEAVYKCHRKEIDFSPTDIPIHLKNESTISFSSNRIYGKTVVTNDYILSVCSDDLTKINYQIFKNENGVTSQSIRNEINLFFKNKYVSAKVGSDVLNLPIALPFKQPISISHHRNYGAFAFPRSIF